MPYFGGRTDQFCKALVLVLLKRWPFFNVEVRVVEVWNRVKKYMAVFGPQHDICGTIGREFLSFHAAEPVQAVSHFFCAVAERVTHVGVVAGVNNGGGPNGRDKKPE